MGGSLGVVLGGPAVLGMLRALGTLGALDQLADRDRLDGGRRCVAGPVVGEGAGGRVIGRGDRLLAAVALADGRRGRRRGRTGNGGTADVSVVDVVDSIEVLGDQALGGEEEDIRTVGTGLDQDGFGTAFPGGDQGDAAGGAGAAVETLGRYS